MNYSLRPVFCPRRKVLGRQAKFLGTPKLFESFKETPIRSINSIVRSVVFARPWRELLNFIYAQVVNLAYFFSFHFC